MLLVVSQCDKRRAVVHLRLVHTANRPVTGTSQSTANTTTTGESKRAGNLPTLDKHDLALVVLPRLDGVEASHKAEAEELSMYSLLKIVRLSALRNEE